MKTILALIPNWIGDVAMCTPALRALHRRYPDAALIAAGRASACALLSGLPWIARTEPLGGRDGLAGILRARIQLRALHPDTAVVFPHSFRGALLAWLSGAPERVGYARGGRSLLLTRRVEPHRVEGRIAPLYMAREYLELVRVLGCEDDGKGLELAVDPELAASTRERYPGDGPLVGIAPGAAFGPSKLWPADRYAAVADALHEQAGAHCVLLTGPGEENTRDAVLAAATHPLQRPAEPPSIDGLKASIAALDLLVCNDSGSRHVAVAFRVPTICIMGPTAPVYSEGPYERGEVIRIDVDCGPCQKPVCTTDHRCMTGIPADRVIASALQWLRDARDRMGTLI
ncbi:MAG: lipopolysaccharide heptosyltransferase II [Candidatus Hydrogenedentes bacterium]|nr:lipopolysaccharide heptosyltransferase II [Candidatus Hydrogenedentota bacterium]